MRFASLACLVLLSACDGPSAAPDAGSDAGVPSCEGVPPIEHGGDGSTDPLAVPPGEVRAGRLEAAELPPWPTGLEAWAPGDFVLTNGRSAVVIEDVGPSDLYDRTGGRPVGLTLVEGGALVRPADFEEVLLGPSGHLIHTDRVSVVADGSDGGPAIVRASGTLHPIDFVGVLLDALRGRDDFDGWRASLDYVLTPGEEGVEVILHVDQPEGRNRVTSNVLLGFIQGFRMPVYVPGEGFVTLHGNVPYVAYDDEHGGAGWAWVAPDEAGITTFIDDGGVTVTSLGRHVLPACSRVDLPLGRIVVGDGIAGLVETLAAGAAPWRFDVAVRDRGAPVAGVRVHVTLDDGRYWARRPTGDDGLASFAVPAGTAGVDVHAYRPGFPVQTVHVEAPASVATIDLATSGELHVVATEGGEPVPARVQVLPASGAAPRPPESFGERRVTGGRSRVEFPTTGEITMALPPGDYRVIVSRGYEYELSESLVTITAGATNELPIALVHSVDTTGVLCADYHIHTTRSLDSEDDVRLKVAALVADGLEIPVRSDHEFVAEMQPVIESLGVERFAVGLVGEELSTWEWGHFGVFPLVHDPAAPSGGRIPWEGRLPPAVFADVRARPEAPLLVVNHPRAGSIGFGYFTVADYDPVTGTAAHPELWDDGFSILEVVNGSSFRQNRDGTIRDWFSFLSQARSMWAVGSSDSHRIHGDPVGYPRTCLVLGTDDPRAVTPAMVAAATGAGRAYVSGGIYLDVEGPGGEGPGERASGVGDVATFHVVVRAAEWMPITSLEVIVDGATTETFPLGPATGVDPTVRFDGPVAVPVAASAAGSWVVFHASAETDMVDLHPGREPFAFTNPVFLTR